MNVKMCDLCFAETGKYVKSEFRWGYTRGFKLDLCKPHTKTKNPFKGMKETEAYKKYLSMRFPD